MENENKKGASDEAKKYAEEVTKRFTEFIKGKGMREVSDHVMCNYQALRNSVADGHNPSLVTLCQVILGYPDEIDINYLFTGKRDASGKGQILIPDAVPASNDYIRLLEEQIGDLKQDKEFLQSIIKKQ